ncbi:arylesterase [Pseudomonas sp. Marseille-QA0892]
MRRFGIGAFALMLLLQAPGALAGTVLIVGDSISAGFGLNTAQGWVSLLQQRLKRHDPSFDVVNASISGDTSAGGLTRLPGLLDRHKPEVVVIELGGNDGLRGQPPEQLKQNLTAMTEAAQSAGARVLILGMQLPPNYGQRYTQAFAQTFRDVSAEQNVAIVPFMLDGVGAVEGMMQPDGIHPNAAAQPRLLENVWPALVPLLQ